MVHLRLQSYVRRKRQNIPIEVETRTLQEVNEVLDFLKTDKNTLVTRLMLDNMTKLDSSTQGDSRSTSACNAACSLLLHAIMLPLLCIDACSCFQLNPQHIYRIQHISVTCPVSYTWLNGQCVQHAAACTSSMILPCHSCNMHALHALYLTARCPQFVTNLTCPYSSWHVERLGCLARLMRVIPRMAC